jgi:phospholipid/cholesterol/gamma-HCH transport system substrate-binding protein
MSMRTEKNHVRLGLIGTAVLLVITLLAVNLGNLPLVSGGTEYTARFADAGGLAVGDDVMVGGFKIGSVDKLALDRGQVAVSFRVRNSAVRLGDQTSAAIKTATVLGTRNLALASRGTRALAPGAVIPIERTTSPYQLTDALGTLTTKVHELDTDQLARSMQTIAETLRTATPDVPAALDGVSRLSTTLNERDAALTELLAHAEGVTGVLAQRSGQITQLLEDGSKLLAEVQQRRAVINEIFLNVSTLSNQLTGLVRDNSNELPSALDRLNDVLELLRRNQGNLAAALQGLGPFATALGESVASGPWFNAYVPNLVAGNLSPLIDYLPKGLPSAHPASAMSVPGSPPDLAPLPKPGKPPTAGPPTPPGPPQLPALPPAPQLPRLARRRRDVTDVDEPSGRGGRRWLAAALAVVVLLTLVAVTAVGVSRARQHQLTVYFPGALGLYAGDEVRVLGVPVGEVDSVTPDGPRVRVDLRYDADVPVPANAGAAIVAQTLVTARFVQLTPAYTGGPVLAEGAVIPEQRTVVPVEWDQVKDQVSKLAQALGPGGANRDGALSELVQAGADVGRGQGTKFRETIAALSSAVDTLSQSRGDLFGTVRNLQVFVTALRSSDELVDEFTRRLASVSTILNDNRTSLAAALADLDQAAGQVADFVQRNRDGLRTSVDDLGQVTSVLASQRSRLENILHTAPTALSNFYNIYDPASGSLTGALAASNIQSPAEMVCSGIAAASSTTPEQANSQCKQYLGPLLNLVATNYPPVGVNPVVRQGGAPRQNSTAGPELPVPAQPGPPSELSKLLLGGGN